MGRPRLSEEEKKARVKEYNRIYHQKRVSDPEKRKAYNAMRRAQYYANMQNPEWREKENARNRQRWTNMTEEQRRHYYEVAYKYKREDRALKRELGVLIYSDEQRERRNEKQKERNKERYRTDPAYRKARLKYQRAYYKRKKRETEKLAKALKKNPFLLESEEEFLERAKRMKEEVRKILN